MPIRLLIADVDGTLVTKSKTLTPRGARRRRDCATRAWLSLTSGRPPRGLAALVEALELSTP